MTASKLTVMQTRRSGRALYSIMSSRRQLAEGTDKIPQLGKKRGGTTDYDLSTLEVEEEGGERGRETEDGEERERELENFILQRL